MTLTQVVEYEKSNHFAQKVFSIYAKIVAQVVNWSTFFIIESVDSISRDERDAPLTQYITNAGISRARYTITHFKTPPSCSTADFQSNECITSL